MLVESLLITDDGSDAARGYQLIPPPSHARRESWKLLSGKLTGRVGRQITNPTLRGVWNIAITSASVAVVPSQAQYQFALAMRAVEDACGGVEETARQIARTRFKVALMAFEGQSTKGDVKAGFETHADGIRVAEQKLAHAGVIMSDEEEKGKFFAGFLTHALLNGTLPKHYGCSLAIPSMISSYAEYSSSTVWAQWRRKAMLRVSDHLWRNRCATRNETMNATTAGSISALSATKKAHKLTTRHVELVVRAARATMGRLMAKEVVVSMAKVLPKAVVEDTAEKDSSEVALTAIAAAAKATMRSLTATVETVASMATRQRAAGLSQTVAQKERVAKGSPKFTYLGSVF